MTDRGLPIVDGAPACPFVAFDDDREERASGPDTRHRCYAEIRAAPRAQAHQDAYCLSSAFALCPTFQDWAKREGARVRDEPPAEGLLEDEPPRRNPQRDWSAPPPWLGGMGEGSGQGRGAEHLAEPPDFLGGRRRGEAGLAGSLAHQIALDGAPPPGPVHEGRIVAPGGGAGAEAPYGAGAAWGAGAARGVGAAWGAGSAPGAGAASGPRSVGPVIQADDEDDEDTDDDAVEREHPGSLGRGGGRPEGLARAAGILPGRGRPKVGDTRPRRRGGEPAAPPWERPHRYEAYPTIRTRMGLPAVSRVVVLASALILAMFVLFLLPGLLGLGGPQGSPSPIPSPTRSVAPSGSAGPSIAPGPTAQTYVVQAGDTFSKIAATFGIPLADLIAVNKDRFPNPDKIAVGDTVTIPAPLPSGFSDAGTPAPSVAPAAAPTRTVTPTRTPTRTPTKAPTKAP